MHVVTEPRSYTFFSVPLHPGHTRRMISPSNRFDFHRRDMLGACVRVREGMDVRVIYNTTAQVSQEPLPEPTSRLFAHKPSSSISTATQGPHDVLSNPSAIPPRGGTNTIAFGEHEKREPSFVVPLAQHLSNRRHAVPQVQDSRPGTHSRRIPGDMLLVPVGIQQRQLPSLPVRERLVTSSFIQ